MSKTLYITRPLCPPWDEASKNFAYALARNVRTHEVNIMTHGKLDAMPSSVTQHNIYSACHFGARQKIESLLFQFRAHGRYDIAHYFFTPTPLNSRLSQLALSSRTKTVQTIATLRQEKFTPSQLRKMLFADELITYTEETKKQIQNLGKQNVSCIYPGIDLAHFSPAAKDPALLRKFDIPAEALTISYSGEYVRLGATDTIIAAMEQLWRDEPIDNPHPLIFIMAVRVKNDGDAIKKAEIIAHLEATNNLHRVRFTDTFADMRGIYNLSDIVLFPVADMHGKFDVPLALIEAYACAKPVIVSDIARLAEFTNDTISRIIKPCDTNALADAIRALVHSPQTRTVLGNAARGFAQNRFDIIKTTKNYEKLYRELQR